jgi:hypothetical protein
MKYVRILALFFLFVFCRPLFVLRGGLSVSVLVSMVYGYDMRRSLILTLRAYPGPKRCCVPHSTYDLQPAAYSQ